MDQLGNKTILVLIAGGHASGKESGCKILEQQLHELDNKLNVKKVNMNDYLIEDKDRPGCKEPTLFNWNELRYQLNLLLKQEYDVVILYGLYALYDKQITSLATVKIFIDCDADVRLGRWIERDILSKTRDHRLDEAILQHQQKEELEKVLDIYLNYSRNEMKLYINDTKENADIILPRGADLVGFTLILDGLKPLLLKKIHRHQNMTKSESGDSYDMTSTSIINRETVLHTLKQISGEPSVQSLTNDNFSNTRKVYYDAN